MDPFDTLSASSAIDFGMRAMEGFPLVLTAPRVDNEINIVYGVRAKDKGIDKPIAQAHVGAVVSVKGPDGVLTVVSKITAEDVWRDGMEGDREFTKTFHVPTTASGDYEIHLDSEYGLFWSWDGALGYGCWIGVSADDRPAVSKIWQPAKITQSGIKITEIYTFTKS